VDQLRVHVLALFALCLLLFFPFLGARDFWELENQYAEVVRVMLLEGDYLVPKVNDTFFPESPPLFFWLSAVICWFVGGVSEWAIRLPSALSATELVFIIYFFVRKHFNSRLAILSAVVLAASVLTVHVERHVPVNMLFYLCIAAAMFLFMEVLVFDSERRSHAYGAWLFMALACLSNGPVGLLFPAVAVCIYLALSRRWTRVASLRLFSGALLFMIVTVPWFAHLARNGPADWLESIFVHLYLSLYSGPDQQIFFSFPLAFAPWCFLFIPAAICFWREKSRAWEPPILFFIIWFAVGLFLSVVSFGRHNHYLFLAYIPMAVGVGFYLDQLSTIESDDAVWVWTSYSVIFFGALLLLGGLSGPLIIWNMWPFLSVSVTLLGAAVAGLGGVFLYAWKHYGNLTLIAGFAAFPVVVNLLLQSLIFPDLNAFMFRPLAERMGAALAANPGARLAIHKHRKSHEFNYYSRIKKIEVVSRPNLMSFFDRPGRQLILLKTKDLEELKKISLKNVDIVLDGTASGDHWVLLSSCRESCEHLPNAAKPLDQASDTSTPPQGRDHEHGSLVSGR